MSHTSGTSCSTSRFAALIVGRESEHLELVEDVRLEELERHLLGQPALVQLQLRPTTMTERPE
jgi:hypothetical protein